MVDVDTIFWRICIPLLILGCTGPVFVSGETTWVWNANRSPQSGNTGSILPTAPNNNPNFGQVDFGRDKNSQGGRQSIFPDSPSRPSSPNKDNNNGALPEDSIRLVNNGNSEARLIPGAANFVSNALQSIGGNGGGGGTGGGLLSIGGNLIGSIFQSVPQIAGSALEILLGRPGKGNSGSSSSSSAAKPSSNSGVSTLPGSAPSFPILTPGGSSSTFGRPAAGNSGGLNSGSSSGNCQCTPLNSCFLPRRPGASCAGGNIMCCQTSTRTRSIDELSSSDNVKTNTKNSDSEDGSSPTRAEVRIGLLENIVKGSGNVVDDALDLLLHRYYTEEDQQRIATRVLKSG